MAEKRLNVINSSIFIEKLISAALASFLDIDLPTSKTLGNKSTSFSLNQKINLLTDMQAFDKSNVRKFQIFSEIRNQFAHNLDVYDFTSCFKLIDGSENYLQKVYSNESFEFCSKEDQLETYFNILFKDVLSICHKLLEKAEQKVKFIGEAEAANDLKEYVINALNTLAYQDEKFTVQYVTILEAALKKFVPG